MGPVVLVFSDRTVRRYLRELEREDQIERVAPWHS
jgi:DeoR/GlpR family transcriptional regulator of sugar metabolism